MTFEDSTTYQLILNRGLSRGLSQGLSQGRAEAREAAVKFVVRLGTKKFGAAPSESQLARLREIAEPDRMELLADRVLDATGWDELIAVV